MRHFYLAVAIFKGSDQVGGEIATDGAGAAGTGLHFQDRKWRCCGHGEVSRFGCFCTLETVSLLTNVR